MPLKEKYSLVRNSALILIFAAFFSINSCESSKQNPVSAKEKIFKEDSSDVSVEGIEILKKSYPQVQIEYEFVKEKNDYLVSVENLKYKTSHKFYWCDGKMLPEEELKNQDQYKPFIYRFSNVLREPSEFTDDELERLREYTKRENRKNNGGESHFFLEAVYNCHSRGSTEKQIIGINIFGKNLNVHKDIKVPLKKVEARVTEEAKHDAEIKKFIDGLKSCGGYNWRLIDGTKRKSMHCLGIAIDILPKRITGEIFWGWARDKNPKGWMKTPLKSRWIPPKKVIDIFEEEGFIWGGYWPIWDNMHFEYRPELLEMLK